jgi:hypothetical protein
LTEASPQEQDEGEALAAIRNAFTALGWPSLLTAEEVFVGLREGLVITGAAIDAILECTEDEHDPNRWHVKNGKGRAFSTAIRHARWLRAASVGRTQPGLKP